MAETFRPERDDDIADLITWAAAGPRPLELFSGGSKRPIGRPPQTEYGLDLSAIAGIVDYEPAELVLTARAATPLSEVTALLDQSGQMLSFEPVDIGALVGTAGASATLAGTYATNFAGPRRIQAGAVRDNALGIKAVSGRGEAFKSGGRVMKNVTGYDLTKGLSGSWGTLAVFTELSFKVLPRPETACTVVLPGLTAHQAMAALATGMGSSCDVSGAAHLPADIVDAMALDGLPAGRSATVFRLEGVAPSVAARARMLATALSAHGRSDELDAGASTILWRMIGDAAPFAADLSRPLWRISVTPTKGADVVAAIAGAVDGVRVIYDWAGGLIWLELADGHTVHDARIREAVVAHGGGHATLIRADATARAAIAPFQPQPAALAALSAKLKAEFDPVGILNPGRMWAGV